MAIDLGKYGISGSTEIIYNPSYELLFEEETKAGLEGYEVGRLTELDAVNVMTGIYTGDGQRNWVFYTRSLHIFQRKFNEAMAPFPALPLQFEAEEDPDWQEYREMCQCEVADGED